MQRIPCASIGAVFIALIVHTGPAVFAAANVDHVARRDRDGLRSLVEARAFCRADVLDIEVRPDKVVLVCGGRCQRDVGAVAVDEQRVIIAAASLAGGKRARQLAALDAKGFQRRVRVVPRTAKVAAEAVRRVHDVDHVAVRQAVIGIRCADAELAQRTVAEEVVQRAHPAGACAAGELCERILVLGDRRKIRDTEVPAACTVPVELIILQCAENDGHSRVVLAKRIIRLIHERLAVVVEELRGFLGSRIFERRAITGAVLHDDSDGADT